MQSAVSARRRPLLPLLRFTALACAGLGLALGTVACGADGGAGDEAGTVAFSLHSATDAGAQSGLERVQLEIAQLAEQGEEVAEPFTVELNDLDTPAFVQIAPDQRTLVTVRLLASGNAPLGERTVEVDAAAGDLVEIEATSTADDQGITGVQLAEARNLRPGRDYTPGQLYLNAPGVQGQRLYDIIRELGVRLVGNHATEPDTYLLEAEGMRSVAGLLEHALTIADVSRAWPAYHSAAKAGPVFVAGTVAARPQHAFQSGARSPFSFLASGRAQGGALSRGSAFDSPEISRVNIKAAASTGQLLSAAWSTSAARYTDEVNVRVSFQGVAEGTEVVLRVIDAERGIVVDAIDAVVDAAGDAAATWSYDFLDHDTPGSRFFFMVDAAGVKGSSDTLQLTEPFQLTFRSPKGVAIQGLEYRLDFSDGSTLTATTDLMGALVKDDYVPSDIAVVDPRSGRHVRTFNPIRHLQAHNPSYLQDRMRAAAPGQSLWTRIHAINDIGNMRAKEAIPFLSEMLSEQNAGVWYNAALALGNMQVEHPTLVQRITERMETAGGLVKSVDILGALGGEAAGRVLRAFSDHGDENVRTHVMYALGRMPASDENIDALLANLDGVAYLMRPELRAEAARALGRMGDRRAIDALSRMLNDSFGVVRLRAAEALQVLVQPGDLDAAQTLREHLEDRDHRVSLAAAQALVKIEGEASLGEVITASRNGKLPRWAGEQMRREARHYER